MTVRQPIIKLFVLVKHQQMLELNILNILRRDDNIFIEFIIVCPRKKKLKCIQGFKNHAAVAIIHSVCH
jgi:hypothetical protein